MDKELFEQLRQSMKEATAIAKGQIQPSRLFTVESPALKVVPYVADPEESFRGLRSTVLQYDAPMEPVEVEGWEALK